MNTTAELASRNGGSRSDAQLYRNAVKKGMRKRVCGSDNKWRSVDPTEAEVDFLLMKAATYGLDPLAGQIYASWDRGYIEVVTTIDGLRLLAERTGKYIGQAPAEWCDTNGEWRDVWLGEDYPAAARVGVYKEGRSEPTIGTAHWSEFSPKGSDGGEGMWQKGTGMPAHMLSIRAEALALRKAFPAELGGLYTAEELGLGRPTEPSAAEPADPVGPGTDAPRSDPGPSGPSVLVDDPGSQPSGAPALPATRRTLAEALKSGEYARLRSELTMTLFDQHPDRLTDEQAERVAAALGEAEEGGITPVELERACKVGLRQEDLAVRARALSEWIAERCRRARLGAGEEDSADAPEERDEAPAEAREPENPAGEGDGGGDPGPDRGAEPAP